MLIRALAVGVCMLCSVGAYAKDDCKTAAGKTFSGKVSSITDGDTFSVSGQKVRLFGLDAPPDSSQAGKTSTRALTALLTGKDASCLIVEKSKSGRCVAVCSSGSRDIAEQMILNGSAFAARGLTHFSDRRQSYDAAEQNARANKRGFWAQ